MDGIEGSALHPETVLSSPGLNDEPGVGYIGNLKHPRDGRPFSYMGKPVWWRNPDHQRV